MYNYVIAVDAGEDLELQQWKAVNVSGVLADTGVEAMGILQNAPRDTEDASLIYLGRSKFAVGAAVAAGAILTVANSGWFVTAASGDTVIGKAIFAASSGEVAQDGIFNFATGLIVS